LCKRFLAEGKRVEEKGRLIYDDGEKAFFQGRNTPWGKKGKGTGLRPRTLGDGGEWPREEKRPP